MTNCEKVLTVNTEHLVGEMLLIDVGHTTIISDHPESMGGQGKGPNPGELVKGALASSAVIAVGRMIEREGLTVRSFSVACSTGFETERREEGPLPSSTTLAGFQLHVAVIGALDDGALAKIEHAALRCPIACVLTDGIGMEERNVFKQEPARRPARATSHLIEQMKARRPGAGEKVVQPPNGQTGVRADYLGEGRALLKWSKTAYLIQAEQGEDQVRPDAGPEVLLLAGLSACTSVFVARAAALTGADAEVRVITSGRRDPASNAFLINKTLEVTGDLNDSQKETLAYFGDNCAIGETLRRKAQIAVTIDLVASDDSDEDRAIHSLAARDAKVISARLDEVVCDDGACCVPDFDSPTLENGR